MEMSRVDNIIFFSGKLDELFDKEEFAKNLLAISSESTIARVCFEKVSRINSCGVAELMRALESVPIQIEAVNCPSILVEQFNIISEFFGYKFTVRSVIAPFLNLETGAYAGKTVEICEKFMESDSFKCVENPLVVDGKSYIAEFERDEFFFFVTLFQY